MTGRSSHLRVLPATCPGRSCCPRCRGRGPRPRVSCCFPTWPVQRAHQPRSEPGLRSRARRARARALRVRDTAVRGEQTRSQGGLLASPGTRSRRPHRCPSGSLPALQRAPQPHRGCARGAGGRARRQASNHQRGGGGELCGVEDGGAEGAERREVGERDARHLGLLGEMAAHHPAREREGHPSEGAQPGAGER